MKQDEEQKTLTLTLPFLDFKDTNVSSESKDSYKKSGLYFVRSGSGEHLITSVMKEEGNVWVWPLPPGVTEVFCQQHTEKQQADKFEQLEQRLIDIHNDIATRLDEQHSIIRMDIDKVHHMANRIENKVCSIAKTEEHLSSNNPNTERPNGGYVDQDVLLQIIKEVKR